MVQDNYISYLGGLTAYVPITIAWGARFTLATNLFNYVVPETPVDLIAVIPYGGRAPDSKMPDVYYPNMQIWIRSVTPKKAINTGNAIIRDLHNNPNIIHGVVFAINSSPLVIGIDDKGRFNCTVNFKNNYVNNL